MTKRFSLIIAFCMLVNNSAVIGAVDTRVFDVSSPVIQTSVFQLTSLIRLPFTLTSKIVSEEAPLLPEYKKAGSNKAEDKSRDSDKGRKTSGDYSFFFSNAENSMRLNARTGGSVAAQVFDSIGLAQGSGIMLVNLLFLWLGFKYIFLIACLMALSKSNLPWEIRDVSV